MLDAVTLSDIEKVMEEEVRPALLSHEGNVKIVSYEGGILRIKLLGQCSGCPSASLTTEELIGTTIKNRLPEVKDVVLVNEVSQDLIDMAKRILNHEK